MTTRAVAEVDDWNTVRFGGGYAGLRDLADAGFSGVVQAGAAKLCLLNGTPVGVLDGTIEDFEDAAGTAYEAPSPALPLLALMQDRGDEVRAEYYTEETPVSEVDRTLSEGGFSGYIELSDNVLSGDYYVVYHAGRSMAVAWVGNVGELLTDDEAFQRADDEVGIYQVRQVDVEPIEIPGPSGASDTGAGAAGGGGAAGGATDAGAAEASDTAGSSDDTGGGDGVSGTDGATSEATETGTTGATEAAGTEPSTETTTVDATTADSETATAAESPAETSSSRAAGTATTETDRAGSAESTESTTSAESTSPDRVRERESASQSATAASGESTDGDDEDGTAAPAKRLETRSIPSLDPERTNHDRETDSATGVGGGVGAGAATGAGSEEASSRSTFGDEDANGGGDGDEDASEGGDGDEDASQSQSGSGTDSGTDMGSSAPSADKSATTESSADESATTESSADESAADTRPETTDDIASEPSESGPADEPGGPSAVEGAASDSAGTPEPSRAASSERVAELGAEIEEHEAEIARLEAELASVQGERDDLRREREELREERDALQAERDELAAEVDQLEAETDRLRSELEELEAGSGGAIDAERQLSPSEALDGTNLFVRYGSKGKATLESAHDGNASRADVIENLGLEHHTQFEAANASVDGQSFEAFLRETLEYRFVTWVVEDLVYEIRDAGRIAELQDLYDAIPEIDRAELDGEVTVEFTEDGQEKHAEESFDVVLRDRLGNPLVVAELSASREAATESMMSSLVTASSRVSESNASLAAAVFVTSSFFEPGALETADAATGHGRFSRDKRESFVKHSRNRGYHLCLAEARDGRFHLAVPDL